jgi:heterodisulfide reductase subunit A-like polyferredoxin
MTEKPCLLYCHCAYAKVVPEETRREVLKRLNDAGVAFEAVPDLCEMSARKDPALERLAATGAIRIAACYPRAVKWLFHAAGAPLDDDQTEILNMRVQTGDDVADAMCRTGEASS